MPSFSDDFLKELENKFLTEKKSIKELQKWSETQINIYLQQSIKALTQQETKLEKLVNEISFTKKVIKNLKNRIEILQNFLKDKG